jgi:UDP-N-acetylglucosamine 2-epimerase (non-hydrolysing)
MGENDDLAILVVGARPNFMKIAPLVFELGRRGVRSLLLHTGQHYDEEMSRVFFHDLGLPEPDIYLGVGSGSHAEQTAKIMVEFEKVCISKKPNLVVVVGDVNSTLACTLVAKKMHIKTAHIEAGLRSGDSRMPEEINRILTDSIADFLFTPSKDGDENLISEGRTQEDIFCVGNIMIDSLILNLERAKRSMITEELGLGSEDYGLVTLHRAENVDHKEVLNSIIEALQKIGSQIKLILPLHPRTKKRLGEFGLYQEIEGIPGVIITGPLGYLDFISLLSQSSIVLTDSGGLQEESSFLGIPCLTIRESTERPITVTEGTNTVVGTQAEAIWEAFKEKSNVGRNPTKRIHLWDGKTASRIADILF